MSKKLPNDGGSAFPRPYSTNPHPWDDEQVAEDVLEQEGMTLREYYAGQAMLGLLSSDIEGRLVTELAVERADSLIAELEKERPESGGGR